MLKNKHIVANHKSTYKTLKISYAVGIALATMGGAAEAAKVSATGGVQLNLTDYAIYQATNEDVLLITGMDGDTPSKITGIGVILNVNGSSRNAARVENGGQLSLTDSTLDINGSGSAGLTVSGNKSHAELLGNTMINAFNGYGVKVSNGATALLSGTTINMTSPSVGIGIDVSGSASTVTANNVNISAERNSNQTAHGIQLENSGAINMTGGSINITGAGAGSGVLLMGGTLNLDGVNITTDGKQAQAYGLNVNTGTNIVDVRNSTITSAGPYNNALWSVSDGNRITATNTDFKTTGNNANAVNMQRGIINIEGGSITTDGGGSYGFYTEKEHSTANNVRITTNGNNSHGVFAYNNGAVELTNSTVTTTNDNSAGMLAHASGLIDASNVAISTSGYNASGIHVQNLGRTNLNSVSVHTTGDSAAGVKSVLTVPGYSNTITLTDSVIDTQNGPAIRVIGGGLDLTLNNTSVIGRLNGGDGAALTMTSYNNSGTLIAPETISITANDSSIVGDMIKSIDTAVVNLQLNGRSALNGSLQAVDSLNITADSTWNVRGDSTLNTLTNSGNINYLPPVAGTFKTVTVSGNYTGGGTLAMNVALAGDSSTGDKLVVNGDTAGTTGVKITNAGGSGGLTGNGIELIHVGGNSAGVFNQQGQVIVAGYEYTLYKGSLSDPNDGNWYLRSVALPTPPAPDPDTDPTPNPGPSPTPDPNLQWISSTVGAYLGNQTAAINMFNLSLHDRLGEPQFTQSLNDRRAAPSVWVRVSSDQEKSKAVQQALDLKTDSSVVQIGSDVALSRGNSRWHLGGMIGYGHSKTDSTNPVKYNKLTKRTASGTVDGYSIGAYATWFGNADQASGPYVDTWLQYGWYDNDVSVSGGKTDSYKSRNLSASVEAGYAFKLNDNGSRQWMIEPQAQVIFNSYDADDHYTAYGDKVNGSDADGVTTRVGARVYSRTIAGNGIQPFVEANWLHGDADNSLQFSNGASNRFSQNIPKDRYELKAGVQAALTKNLHGWASFGWQTGDNSYQRLEGLAGVKYVW